MRRKQKWIAAALSCACIWTLCACDVQIDVNIAPKATPTQPAQATKEPGGAVAPAPTNEVPETPEATPAPLPRIQDEAVVKSLCLEWGVGESLTDPAIFSEVYDVDAIAYRCDKGKFYVRYDENLDRTASFYLKDDLVSGFPVRACTLFGDGWLLFTETIPAQEIPETCLYLPGYEKLEKANLLCLLRANGEIEKMYAVPYAKSMEGSYLHAPRVVGKYISVFVEKEKSVLLNPMTGKLADTGKYRPYDFLAMNEDGILYEKSAAEGERQIVLLDRAGKVLGETTVSNRLGMRAAPDGSIYLSGGTGEKDFNVDDRSHPIAFLNDAYEFEEKIGKNEIYERVAAQLEACAPGDVRYHIQSLEVKALSEERCSVLCGVTILEGEEILSLSNYVLLHLDL